MNEYFAKIVQFTQIKTFRYSILSILPRTDIS